MNYRTRRYIRKIKSKLILFGILLLSFTICLIFLYATINHSRIVYATNVEKLDETLTIGFSDNNYKKIAEEQFEVKDSKFDLSLRDYKIFNKELPKWSYENHSVDDELIVETIDISYNSNVYELNFDSKSITSEEIKAIYESLPIDKNAPWESMEISKEDFLILAKTSFYEYGYGCYEGQAAIIGAILNRVDSSLFPNNIKEVIIQKNQFNPKYAENLDNFEVNEQTTLAIYESVVLNKDYSNGAMAFYTPSIVTNPKVLSWFESFETCAEYPDACFKYIPEPESNS